MSSLGNLVIFNKNNKLNSCSYMDLTDFNLLMGNFEESFDSDEDPISSSISDSPRCFCAQYHYPT